MFLLLKIKKIALLAGIIWGVGSHSFGQDTLTYYQQWQQGLNLLQQDTGTARLLIENAIFGFANQKQWESAIQKASTYSQLLAQTSQKEYASKWAHYANEWSAEKLGKPNLHYGKVLENASLLNFLNGDYLTAYELLKKTISVYQKCESIERDHLIRLHQDLAHWAETIGNWEDAYRFYSFLYQNAPNPESYLLKLGNIAYENLDYWKAKEYFSRLYQHQHHDSTLYLKLSECYFLSNQIDSAEHFLRLYQQKIRNVALERLPLRYFELKAWLSTHAKAYQEAIDALQLALQHLTLSPLQKAYVHWDIGKIWASLGLLENAEHQYKLAVQQCPDSLFLPALIAKDLAELYLKKSLLPKAEEQLLSVHKSFHSFLGRFHPETLHLDALLGKLYFQKKDFKQSLYFYQLALENAQYHPELSLTTLKLYRQIISNWQQTYLQKQHYAILKEILSLWKAYIQYIAFALQYPYAEEELLLEVQAGLLEACNAFLYAYFRKGQSGYLVNAYYCHWLWKKIKQKSLQQLPPTSPKYQNLALKKQVLEKLILKELSGSSPSFIKIHYWRQVIDTLRHQLLKEKFLKTSWFNPFTKTLFTTDPQECQIAYFIGPNDWIVFVHYQDQLFFQYYPDNYELKNYLYLLQKENENTDYYNRNYLLERLSAILLAFPLHIIRSFPKIKTLHFSLDEPMFHLELDQLYALPLQSKKKVLLSQKFYLQRRLVPF